jgi:hypothetical protein
MNYDAPRRPKRKSSWQYRRFRCRDCHVDTHNIGHYYMVTDELWAASGMKPNGGMLCLGCLEQRIGRPLTVDDFTAFGPPAWPWFPMKGERWRKP